MDQTEQKRLAAQAAIGYVPQRGIVGLGSGSTAKIFVELFAALVKDGRALTGVASSRETAELATSLGIPLLDETGPWDIDVCFDGADEVDPKLNVIKGGGGAVTREHIVMTAATDTILLVDESKLSPRLGTKWPVPVEVVRFGHAATARMLAEWGEPKLRRTKTGDVFVTDQGGVIYDVHTGPLEDPMTWASYVKSIAGVVECGVIISAARLVIVAGAKGVRELKST